ncbi:MAG: hypothetical protein JNK05_04415 [Myxococcales bacterium]|nr:hypothetical protein [Myxococcales bacterium]
MGTIRFGLAFVVGAITLAACTSATPPVQDTGTGFDAVVDVTPTEDTGVVEDTAEPDVVECRDLDLDGFLSFACGGQDCNDNNRNVRPNATEICNNVDDNCDGRIDVDAMGMSLQREFWPDNDGDGFGDRSATGSGTVIACRAPAGFVDNNTDCNDRSSTINPSVAEACNDLTMLDENCNGMAEEGCACPRPGATRTCCGSRGSETCTRTAMGLMWANCSARTAPETCNRVDDDCNGLVDDGVTITCYTDFDEDGYPAATGTRIVCPDPTRPARGGCPAGTTNRSSADPANVDCNDNSPLRSPGLVERCDDIDNDCNPSTANGSGDPGVGARCMVPGRLGRCAEGTGACVGASLECLGSNTPLREVCNGVDDDCDGVVDGRRCFDSQTAPTGSGTCDVGGVCRLTACEANLGNCDAMDANGCETPLLTDANHCGTCGARCNGGPCVNGQCRDMSPAQVSASDRFACAVSGLGTVHCWGENSSGQLGDGTMGNVRISSVQVTGITDAVEVATSVLDGSSFGHACARRSTGAVVCWGNNEYGQVGDNTLGNVRLVPVAVAGLTDAVSIAAGSGSTCAVRATGQVVCWGRNNVGQIGDGTSGISRRVPTPVVGITDAVEVGVGGWFACARRATGAVNCWGMATFGALGHGTDNPDQPTPVAVRGLVDAVQIAVAARSVCARRATGGIACWGRLSGSVSTTAPVQIPGVTDAVSLEHNGSSGCFRSQAGQHEFFTVAGRFPAPSLRDAVTVALGENVACGRNTAGRLFCVGTNMGGRRGDGTTDDNEPVPFATAPLDTLELSTRRSHLCVRRSTGSVECVGFNNGGALGTGTVNPQTTFAAVPGITDAVELDASDNFTCIRRVSGQVVCWGSNGSGELGDGTMGTLRTAPIDVSDMTDAAEITTGRQHTCARRTSGAVACWGANGRGQVGDGSTVSTRRVPVTVLGVTNVLQLASYGNHTCALRMDRSVVCWGANEYGQLGDGTLVDRRAPVAVLGLTDAVEIGTGELSTCARRATGEVVCWGFNSAGQLGDATNTDRNRPTTTVVGLTNATKLSVGADHACAVRTDGSVICWGTGGRTQLGDGGTTGRNTPVTVSGLSNVVELSLGDTRSCARRMDGQWLCWGSNSNGTLGTYLIPRIVTGF